MYFIGNLHYMSLFPPCSLSAENEASVSKKL